MAVKIRLKRMGKIRQPYYRIIVADARKKRDGRVIEEIGKYHPKQDPSFIEVDSERALYWLGVGAQPSEPVAAILKVTGDWQQFKGEPAPAPMRTAEAKRDKTDIFNDALKDAQHEPATEAVTPKRSAKKAEKAPAEGEQQPDETSTSTKASTKASTEASTEAPTEAAADSTAETEPAASSGEDAPADADAAPAGTRAPTEPEA
ncbi:MAG: 30S ribosomal protein S16 [Nocardioidaceae bacterium]